MVRNEKTGPILVKALRSAIQHLERSEDLTPDDPVLREIKSSILRTIAAREQETATDSAA